MSICAKISQDVAFDCDNPPVSGIEQKIILVNRDDIENVVYDATSPGELITDITLKTGTTGYEIQGIKQVMGYSNTLVTEENSLNGVTHSIDGIRFYDPSVESQKTINDFINGANVVAIVEKKWKGVDSANSFKVFGLVHGLEITDLTDNSRENDGTSVITLSTPSGYKEPKVPHQLLETDYATTKTAFDNKFAA